MRRPLSLPLYAGLSAAVAVLCGMLHALPLPLTHPTGAALAAAARGLAAAPSAQTFDRAAAWLWTHGGPTKLALGQWLGVLIGWTLVSAVVLALLWLIIRLLDGTRIRLLLFFTASVLLLATGLAGIWNKARQPGDSADLRLLVPVELAEAAARFAPGEVFANPAALAGLRLFAPSAVPAVPASGQWGQAPADWRAAARRERWKAVVLAGPISQYRPLLEHLMVSPDWHLAGVTNQGFLFLRGPGEPARAVDIANFALATTDDTAVYLSQIAECYQAIGRTGDARSAMERALQLAPESLTVLSHAASFAAGRKDWQNAILFSGRVLEHQPDSVHALLTQALALIEIGEASRAEALCDRVLARVPEDTYTLFLQARICRALHDYQREADMLERLVAVGSRAGRPVDDYRVFLGQAYVRLGRADEALETYRTALAGGRLNPAQVAELRDAIATIEARRIK